jgi:hypothetical protein
MTPDQLLECSPAELAAMTDAQLLEYYKPVLHITRPELAIKPTEHKKTGASSALLQKQSEVMTLMKSMGMDLPI